MKTGFQYEKPDPAKARALAETIGRKVIKASPVDALAALEMNIARIYIEENDDVEGAVACAQMFSSELAKLRPGSLESQTGTTDPDQPGREGTLRWITRRIVLQSRRLDCKILVTPPGVSTLGRPAFLTIPSPAGRPVSSSLYRSSSAS